MVAYNVENNGLVLNTSSIEVDNFPDLTMNFDAGDYKIEYYSVFDNAGALRVDLILYIDAVMVNSVADRIFGAYQPDAICSVIVSLTEGEHTLSFKALKTGGDVTIRNRYYIISKIS